MSKSKWGSSSNFRKGEKVTFAIKSGLDGPFDGPSQRAYHHGKIIQGNGKAGRLHHTYQINSDLGILNILADEIWSKWN